MNDGEGWLADLSYSSPSRDGEGDQPKAGGGEWGTTSGALRALPSTTAFGGGPPPHATRREELMSGNGQLRTSFTVTPDLIRGSAFFLSPRPAQGSGAPGQARGDE
ncbi:hypothetical protein SJA_C1-22150 [Sphingobium indicum UT26S]|uniref:Uncharacterized protein n=1 Tax=Sphingobium indicum (strain DSM 16413 / CCM 7287 / MTCC 6362 / UT26 / NBRC 101211 / UT26S) TaxID=452662 RepID=D4Z367_SPHIU|nr:hypothetical protein SJA_C1-22150 [Sphingobium indicum UT26S]